jgi:hypothetical protein
MIYDLYELLGRGIIAARSKRSSEAMKYLQLAAEVDPGNARVWLWLAAADESVENQRGYLRRALEVDPHAYVARVLLDRLDRRETAAGRPGADFAIFTCPHCGGKQRFDPDISGLVCTFCNQVERMALRNASEDEADLEKALTRDQGNWSVVAGEATCTACGAKTSLPAAQATLRCPFCTSDLVTVRPVTPGLVSPTAMAPFQYHEDDVLAMLGEHWGVRLEELRPLIDRRELTITPVYLPFWSFDGRVQIRCALSRRVDAAEFSNTERVIYKEQHLKRTSWFECDIDDFLVYAAHSLSGDEIRRILPFELKWIYAYRAELLAGWQAEYYQIALDDAQVVAHKSMRDTGFRNAARCGLFIEPADMLQDDVIVLDRTYKLILLPVFIVRFGKAAPVLINGQTGKAAWEHRSRWDFLKKWF